MIPPGTGQTWQNLVRSVALGFGRTVSDEEIEFILWERTAFPMDSVNGTRRRVVEWFTDPDAVEARIANEMDEVRWEDFPALVAADSASPAAP